MLSPLTTIPTALVGIRLVESATTGAPIMLRTDVLTRLLVERLHSCGPMSVAAAIDAIESRAPGRSREVIQHAELRGLIRTRHHDDEPAMIEAAGAPRTLAS